MTVMTVYEAIELTLDFAVKKTLIENEDVRFARNKLLEILMLDSPETADISGYGEFETLTPMLNAMTDYAVSANLCADTLESRDLFSARLAGAVTPSPFEVRARFKKKYQLAPDKAARWFYDMCRACDYIKVDRINKNLRYFASGLEITINLSKPEKDPRDIAAALTQKSVGYPRCMLCIENPGYAGRKGFPARQNHRVIPLTLGGESWHMQFSPYLYYNEHCIVFSDEHRPMKICEGGFNRLFDFVDQFPTYFLGSNADLPIVGGSILTHDHFQGGSYSFPMDAAKDEIELESNSPSITAAIIDWPMSCLRLKSSNRAALIACALNVLNAWRKYSDEKLGILAYTDKPHNTVTPILRKKGSIYRLDLVLRNNRTDDQNPLGIFHPHADKHHIKKENIGLIEVMGLMILPGRLLTELKEVEKVLTGALAPEKLSNPGHAPWAWELSDKYGICDEAAAHRTVLDAVGDKCRGVLCDAGVYKQTREGRDGFVKFLNTVGFTNKI